MPGVWGCPPEKNSPFLASWIDEAGSTVDVQDVQIVPGNPTDAMIVYLKRT